MSTLFAARGAVIHAPLWPSLATAMSAVTAVACAAYCLIVGAAVSVAAIGYLFGCIVTVAFASVHRALENKERSNPSFRLQPALGRTAQVAMVLGIAAGLACAFLLATELAK